MKLTEEEMKLKKKIRRLRGLGIGVEYINDFYHIAGTSVYGKFTISTLKKAKFKNLKFVFTEEAWPK